MGPSHQGQGWIGVNWGAMGVSRRHTLPRLRNIRPFGSVARTFHDKERTAAQEPSVLYGLMEHLHDTRIIAP
jgi:hypothetical protein